MTNATLRGKPDAGNPHVRFDEGEVASAKPRRGSLLYNETVKRWLLRIFPWLLLWGSFIAFGLWVRSVQPWEQETPVELHAMDYRRYSQMLGDWHMVFYAAIRHPLYGWLMSPVIGVGSHFHTLGEWPFWCWLVTFFSGVMTFAHFLVYWLLRRLAVKRLEAAALTALFASFAASWLLAACPESFNISCMLALLTLHFALYVHRHAETMDRSLEYAGWGALAVFTGGITCTQVVKTAMAYFVTRRPKWKHVLLIGLAILGAGFIVGVVFMIRLYLRTEPGGYGREFASALHNIGAFFVGNGMPLLRRLGHVFVFFTEPVVTRGVPFVENGLPILYASPLVAGIALLPPLAAVLSALVARRDFIVRLIAAMFLVDVGIHFVLFWGMGEAQIYAGHWYYAVPVLIGCGLVRLDGRLRRWVTAAIAVLAVTIVALNFHAWFVG